jgi:propanol-preferring alcohol dehydrogenase
LSLYASPNADRVLRKAGGGYGVDVVLDFAGTDATLDLAARSLRPGGELVIVGSGGGRLSIRKPGSLPQGARVSLPYWGTRTELTEVIQLARSGVLRVEIERFPLSTAQEAISRLRAGELTGRAVLIPD